MKTRLLAVCSGLMLMLGFQPVQAQSPKESSLIAHLVTDANQSGSHSEVDVFLLLKIGKVEYFAELESGNVISQRSARVIGGGICGTYAEVSLNLLDKNKQETAQGAGQILKFSKGGWKMIALSEGDYACEKLKGIPKSVISCLKVDCN